MHSIHSLRKCQKKTKPKKKLVSGHHISGSQEVVIHTPRLTPKTLVYQHDLVFRIRSRVRNLLLGKVESPSQSPMRTRLCEVRKTEPLRRCIRRHVEQSSPSEHRKTSPGQGVGGNLIQPMSRLMPEAQRATNH